MSARDRKRRREGETIVLLKFSQTTCVCGEKRIAASTCETCGFVPPAHEVNAALQKRRRLASALRNAKVSPSQANSSSVGELVEQEKSILRDLAPAVNKALSASSDQFDVVCIRVASSTALRNAVIQHTELRPHRALRGPLLLLDNSVTLAINRLIETLEESHYDTALRLGASIQTATDDAVSYAKAVSEINEAWVAVSAGDEPLQQFLQIAAKQAAGDNAVEGVLHVANLGLQLVRDKTQLDVLPLEQGGRAVAVSATAQWFFDVDQFWEHVNQQHTFFDQHHASFVSLIRNQEWRHEWTKCTFGLVDAARRIQLLVANASETREFVYACLDFCRDVQESFGKFLLATNQCAASGISAFGDLLSAGVFSLTEWANSKQLSAARPFLVPSRNATAHNDWRLDGNTVILCEVKPPQSGPVKLSIDELVDHALALMEAILGLQFGLIIAAAKCREELPDAADWAASEWETSIPSVLRAGGWDEAKVAASASDLIVHGAANRSVQLVELLTITPYVPSHFEILEAHVVTDRGSRTLQIPLADVFAYSREDDETIKNLRFVKILRMTRIDGEPFLQHDAYFRRGICGFLFPVITDETNLLRQTSVMRAARTIASEAGDHDLAEQLGHAQTQLLYRQTDLRAGVNGLQRLVDWHAAGQFDFDSRF